MSAWLDPLRLALDRSFSPCTLFFRDDDAGWHDDRLRALLDRFARSRMPLDVAVIPMALGPAMARELRQRLADAPALLGLHQHGYRHVDHERAGRKCEFGPSRDGAAQRHDIEQGARMLERLLGPLVDPIFTPPWNRCTVTTGQCLVELGIHVLSREHRAAAFELRSLAELPVSIDWCKREANRAADPAMLAQTIAGALGGGRALGIMLHHAVMDEAQLGALGELLDLLAVHPASRACLMRHLCRPGERATAAAPECIRA